MDMQYDGMDVEWLLFNTEEVEEFIVIESESSNIIPCTSTHVETPKKKKGCDKEQPRKRLKFEVEDETYDDINSYGYLCNEEISLISIEDCCNKINVEEPTKSLSNENTNKKVQNCQICEHTCHSRQALYNHHKRKHPNEKRVLKKGKHLDVPVRDTAGLFLCQDCPAKFTSAHRLREHIFNHESVFPINCEDCSYGCDNESTLKKHEKYHHGNFKRRNSGQPRNSHNCGEECTCSLPLLKLQFQDEKGCSNVSYKAKRLKATPVLESIPKKETTNHSIFLVGGQLGGTPIVLADHRTSATPRITAAQNSEDVCRAIRQSNLKDGVIYVSKSKDILQVPSKDANFICKQVRNIILKKKPDVSVAHRVRHGDPIWDEEMQDKVMEIVNEYLDELVEYPEYKITTIAQLEKISMKPNYIRPNVGTEYESTTCRYCRKNLLFKGLLYRHISKHKTQAVMSLNGACSSSGLKIPSFEITVADGIRQLVLSVQDKIYRENIADVGRAHVTLCGIAYKDLTGADMKLPKCT